MGKAKTDQGKKGIKRENRWQTDKWYFYEGYLGNLDWESRKIAFGDKEIVEIR